MANFVTVFLSLQLICVPPKNAPKDFEVQKLVLTQRAQDLKYDLEVEYYSYGYLTSTQEALEVEFEAINLPTPYGIEASSYEVKREAGNWFLYEHTITGMTIFRPIDCRYSNERPRGEYHTYP